MKWRRGPQGKLFHVPPGPELEKTERLISKENMIPSEMDQGFLPRPEPVRPKAPHRAESRRAAGSGRLTENLQAVLFHRLVIFLSLEQHCDFRKLPRRIGVYDLQQRNRLKEQAISLHEVAFPLALQKGILPVVIEKTVGKTETVDLSVVKFVGVGRYFVGNQGIGTAVDASPFFSRGSGGIMEQRGGFREGKPRGAPQNKAQTRTKEQHFSHDENPSPALKA